MEFFTVSSKEFQDLFVSREWIFMLIYLPKDKDRIKKKLSETADF